MKYECFTQLITTKQGYALGAGGICLFGYAYRWSHKLRELSALEITDFGLFEIDYTLAQALVAISDNTLLVTGATLRTDMALPWRGRTGGVLGSPRKTICSAGKECKRQPHGFSMFTVSGGPGLAACASPAMVESAWIKIARLFLPDEEHMIPGILRESYLDIGMLVLDGTGQQSFGYILAFADGKYEKITVAGNEVKPDASVEGYG